MSEQETTVPVETDTAITDSPTEAPAGETTEQEINWQKRAEDAQAWATRAAQEAAELRQWQEAIKTDPEAQRKFLAEELGYDVEDDTPDDLTDDPVSALDKRLAAIEEKERQAEQERALAQAERNISKAFKEIDPKGELLDDEDREWIVTRAFGSPPTEQGDPDIKAAYEALVARDRAKQEKWAKTKQTKHSFSPVGEPGTETPNLDDDQERIAWMAQRLADRNAG